MAAILKISVLANGAVQLDGAPVALDELARAMDAAGEGAVVWYYRENAADEAPPSAQEVMASITSRRLPVRLSTKADFSDTVSAVADEAWTQLFAAARARAAERRIAIVRPDHRLMLLPAIDAEAAPPAAIAEVERLLPSTAPRKVAAVVDTTWTMAEKPDLQAAGRAVPFFGFLMALAAIGHAVWLFDGHPAGFAGADLVVVDGARTGSLPPGWERLAPSVRVFDRATRQLRRV
jgi:hypothetical protein